MIKFRIPIGDWSNDGHGKCDYFEATADCDDIEAVREAYFAAKEKFPDLCPEGYCKQYGDRVLPAHVAEAATADGWKQDSDWFGTFEFVELVVWFINKGNPALNVKLSPPIPDLSFYGSDSKGRHISFMGYGLFD